MTWKQGNLLVSRKIKKGYIALFNWFLWRKKMGDMLFSQPQEGVFNMEPCTSCDGKRLSHIETGVENCCKNKKQPPPTADM
jgi:hypothetical protein